MDGMESIYCMEYNLGLKPVGKMVRYNPSGEMFKWKEVLHYVFGIQADDCYVCVWEPAVWWQLHHIYHAFVQLLHQTGAGVLLHVQDGPHLPLHISHDMCPQSTAVVLEVHEVAPCVTSLHPCKVQVPAWITSGGTSWNCIPGMWSLVTACCMNLRCIVCSQALLESSSSLAHIRIPCIQVLSIKEVSTDCQAFPIL